MADRHPIVVFALLGMMVMAVSGKVSHDYGDALTKSILFFEGQRSGKLPPSQRMTWRKDSALGDGADIHVDLVGGYYDAGDNVKFNFPMAFTVTTLAWSVLEFGNSMGPDYQHAVEAIRWGTDYLLKATSVPDTVVVQVGDPYGDHDCWERPEDMDTPRTTYVVNKTAPGSEVSAEIAAALAASSMVFNNSDPEYSSQLIQRAQLVFSFADKYQGSYNVSLGKWVCPFYCDFSGYVDELIWGAAWLHMATNSPVYWKYVITNIHYLEKIVVRDIGGNPYVGASFAEFGWDSKDAGINVLLSKLVMKTPSDSSPFILNADEFVCSIMPQSPTKYVQFSPGGLLFKPGGSNIQHTSALSFLLLVYANLNNANKRMIHCGQVVVNPTSIVEFVKSQVDYILGSNPLGMSYMVGYGEKYPQKIHHRGSVIPSIEKLPKHVDCRGGDYYFMSNNSNPNVLTGALVGGPAINDSFADSRLIIEQSEPTTYMNSPFVGVLAYFKSHVAL